jgi:hypothetical protein
MLCRSDNQLTTSSFVYAARGKRRRAEAKWKGAEAKKKGRGLWVCEEAVSLERW